MEAQYKKVRVLKVIDVRSPGSQYQSINRFSLFVIVEQEGGNAWFCMAFVLAVRAY